MAGKTPEQLARDTFRAETVSKPVQYRRDEVTINVDGVPKTFQFREPSLERIKALRKYLEKNGEVDGVVELIIECVVVPGTDLLAYEAADRETFMKHGEGSWVGKLALAIADFLKKKDVAEAKKD